MGIVGLGAATRQIHLPAYAGIPSLEVAGGVDPAAKPGAFPFPLFSSLEELIEKARPDIVAVVTPPEHHFPLASLALSAGCHVFCEKPFVTELRHADALCELSRQTGRFVVVNNQYRFMAIHEAARSRIGTPDFGDLLFLSAHQSFYTSPETEAGWRGQDPQRTCKEFGTHVLDLCRFLFGEDPLTISARMPRVGRGGPDYLDLLQLEFSGDRVAHVTLDRLCRGPHRYLTLRLDGSDGYIETQLGGGIEVHAGVRGGTRRPYLDVDAFLGGRARLFHGERHQNIARDPIDIFAQATRRLVQAFLRALDEGTIPPCSADDNRRTLALMLAAYESDARRVPITLEY